MKAKLFILLMVSLAALISCSQPSTEKYQKSRDRIVNVKDRIVEIPMDSVLCNNLSGVQIYQDKLIITDSKSYDLQIHIFDKKSLRHLASTAPCGQGPSEIANLGDVWFDSSRPVFYAIDYAKYKVFAYHMDSVIFNPLYEPHVKQDLNKVEFPVRLTPVDDTLFCSIVMKPTGNYGFDQYTALWNINTGEVIPFEDLHPEIQRKRYKTAISKRDNLLVENYHRQNLLVIRNLDDGSLRYNIRGDEPDDGWQRHVEYFELSPLICKGKIVSGYKGDSTLETPENPLAAWSSQLILFTLEGDYIQTLETGYLINDFCYDEEMNRIIFSFNDDIQFGYMDMEGIL